MSGALPIDSCSCVRAGVECLARGSSSCLLRLAWWRGRTIGLIGISIRCVPACGIVSACGREEWGQVKASRERGLHNHMPSTAHIVNHLRLTPPPEIRGGSTSGKPLGGGRNQHPTSGGHQLGDGTSIDATGTVHRGGGATPPADPRLAALAAAERRRQEQQQQAQSAAQE